MSEQWAEALRLRRLAVTSAVADLCEMFFHATATSAEAKRLLSNLDAAISALVALERAVAVAEQLDRVREACWSATYCEPCPKLEDAVVESRAEADRLAAETLEVATVSPFDKSVSSAGRRPND